MADPTSPVSHDARRRRDQRRIPFFAGVHRRWLGSARPAEQTVVPALQVQWEARDRCGRSEEHTSELQSPCNLVCRLLLEKKNSSRAARSKIKASPNCLRILILFI